MVIFELLIPHRPLSVQAKGRNLQRWKDLVRGEVAKAWTRPPLEAGPFQLTLVHLHVGDAPDIDNIIKPIQDALRALVYADDALVTDVEGHKRHLPGEFDVNRLPPLLAAGADSGMECVYIRLKMAGSLEDYL